VPVTRASTAVRQQRITLQRRLRAAATERLPLKAAALFFALILWVIVSAQEEVDATVEVPVMPVVTDTGVAVRRPYPTVNVLLTGPWRDLWRPPAMPAIRRAVGPDAPSALAVRLSESDVDLPRDLRGRVRVRDVQPRVVTFRVTVTESRTVPVSSRVFVQLDDGLTLVGRPRLRPESVRVTGTRDQLARVDSIATARRSVLVRDGRGITVPLDTAGLDVRVEPAAVQLFVPLGRDTVSLPPPVPDTADGEVDDDTAAASPPPAPRVRRDTARGDSVRRDSARRDTVRRDTVRRDAAARDTGRARAAGDTGARRP
jgi:hypothetical protein